MRARTDGAAHAARSAPLARCAAFAAEARLAAPWQPWNGQPTLDAVRGRATRRVCHALHEGRAIALLGAGQTGALAAQALGKAATCFLDDTPAKQGLVLHGLPVHAVDAGLRQLPRGALVVVCIFSARHQFVRTRERVLDLRPDCEVASFAEVLHLFEQGLPNLYLDGLAQQLALLPRLHTLRARLPDARSRDVLDAHVRMRLCADFAAGTDARDALEFLGVPDRAALSFVDGGAFDGDTLRDFFAWRHGRFGRVVACEPDAGNADRLRGFVATLDRDARARIEVRETALWSSAGHHTFAATGQVGSALADCGATQVATDTLCAMDHLPDPLLVKLDVEGAEAQVLRGATAWIRRRRPLLAISVYHRPGDLAELFELVDAIGVPYRYHLRCHGGDGTDLMLYCVTDTASRTAAHTRSTDASSR